MQIGHREASAAAAVGNGSDRLTMLPILGVDVSVSRTEEAINFLDQQFEDESQTAVAFANVHLLNIARTDADLRKTLESFVVFNDGLGIDIASRMIYGRPFPDNLNGTDFVPAFFAKSVHSHRVFILGGLPGLAEKSRSNLARQFPRHQFVGAHSGYFRAEEEKTVVQKIHDARADVLLVGLGNPKQENWLAHHLPATGCKLGFGVGAFIDFSSGALMRAPRIMRRVRLEWLFRLALEPRRMFKRYAVGGSVVLAAAFRKRRSATARRRLST